MVCGGDSWIRARPGWGELGPRVSSLLGCQAAGVGGRGCLKATSPWGGNPQVQAMLGKPMLSAEKAGPSPGSPQLLPGVLALNPPCVPLPAWPPGACTASGKSHGQGPSSSGCVGSRWEAGAQPLESCSGWVG